MRGYLMAVRRDSPDQIWELFGNPSEHKEGCADIDLIEESEQVLGVDSYTRFKRVPPEAGNRFVEDADVKIIFDVDSHRV
jgi:hypothetical protein